MNKNDIKAGELLYTDISIKSGKFFQWTHINVPDDIKKQLCEEIKKESVAKFFNLDEIDFVFKGYQDVRNPDNPFGEICLDALAPFGENGYKSYIGSNHIYGKTTTEVCEYAKEAIIEKFGKDTISKNFGLDNKIKTICEIAEDVLDFDTNKERIVDFWDVENDKYGENACLLTVYLDEEYGERDIYEIEVAVSCDGTIGKGYVTSIMGTEELKQALYGISNGTCKVYSHEFADSTISCSELQRRTIQKFNNEQLEAYKKQKKMDVERE